jgi:hypothetical protein
MDGTVDVHGMCFHWRVEGKDPNGCTLHVSFGDFSTSRSYDNGLSAIQADTKRKRLLHWHWD